MIISEKSFNEIGRIMTNGKNYVLPNRREEWDYLHSKVEFIQMMAST